MKLSTEREKTEEEEGEREGREKEERRWVPPLLRLCHWRCRNWAYLERKRRRRQRNTNRQSQKETEPERKAKTEDKKEGGAFRGSGRVWEWNGMESGAEKGTRAVESESVFVPSSYHISIIAVAHENTRFGIKLPFVQQMDKQQTTGQWQQITRTSINSTMSHFAWHRNWSECISEVDFVFSTIFLNPTNWITKPKGSSALTKVPKIHLVKLKLGYWEREIL